MEDASDRDEANRSDDETAAAEASESSKSVLQRLVESFTAWTDPFPSHQRMFPDQ
jgi:hypothetical protein